MANSAMLIRDLENTISNFKSNVDVKIDSVNTSTSKIRRVTDDIYANVNRFKTDMVQNEKVQIAHENILRIDQVIKEQYSDYDAIRRTVMGVVRDFDINLVRNSTIQELSESLWISSSRYWLSYVLIAISAWVNNYPDVARNAVSEACHRDRSKSALFFCLMNMRFGRIETAKRWFEVYLRAADPTVMSRETDIVLQAYLAGVFGRDAELENHVTRIIEGWLETLSGDEEIASEAVSIYRTAIENLAVDEAMELPCCTESCTVTGQLKAALNNSQKYAGWIGFLNMLNVDLKPQNEDNYKERVDEVLLSLIESFDDDEQELKDQQEYFNCIIESRGESETAEQKYDAYLALRSDSFNVGKQMLKWVLYDDNGQTDVYVRRFGFQNTKGWFKQAVGQFTEKLKASYPIEFPLCIDGWTSISTGSDSAEQQVSLEAYYKNNAFSFKYVNTWNIVALIVFIASTALAFVSFPRLIYALVGTVAAAAFLVYRVISANKKYPQRMKQSKELLEGSLAELAESRRVFDENVAQKEKLLSLAEFL